MMPCTLRYFFAVSLLLGSYGSAFTQRADSITLHLEQILRLAQTTSAVRDSVNWDDIRKEMYALSDAAKTPDELAPAVQYLLRALHDFHGTFIVGPNAYKGPARPWVESSLVVSPELLNQYNQNTLPISGQVLGNGFGYIRIPGFVFGEKDRENALALHHLVCTLSAQTKIKGWIIDLRLNKGGTMYPMFTGLAPLLGEGPLGYFTDLGGTTRMAWKLQQGELLFGETPVTEYQLPLCGKSQTNMPVAVLISAGTVSSGEALAVAFRGRPKTRFFGEPTGGYTTNVSWNPLAPDVILQLTVSYYADRDLTIFAGTSVLPEVAIEGGDDFLYPEKDAKIAAAIRWFQGHD